MELKKYYESSNKTLINLFDEILNIYPKDLVKIFNPEYPEELLKKLDDFNIMEKH